MATSKPPSLYTELDQLARMIFLRAEPGPPPFGLRSMSLQQISSLRLASRRKGNFEVLVHADLAIALGEIAGAREDRSAKAFGKAIVALAALTLSASRARNQSKVGRALVLDITAGIKDPPEWVRQAAKLNPKRPSQPLLVSLTGYGPHEWDDLMGRLRGELAARSMSSVDQVAAATDSTPDLEVASRLARMAEHDTSTGPPPEPELLAYDLGDRGLRISRVTVSGFRGARDELSLDATKNGKPVSVLLWGDNGVGKSTIIDGLEFALQQRVDRSSDFNSTLRPSIRNLGSRDARAAVELSDGSVVERHLTTNSAGRDEPSSRTVRPGFRIAPLVLRRADILRFLDTEALSRGTVFFDYFPDPQGSLGVRPDEELKTLEEERFVLRVVREDAASRLQLEYPETKEDLTNANQLEQFVERLLGQVDDRRFPNRVDGLPQHVREQIAQLRTASQRLSTIKKKLDRGVEMLNPVAYRSQLQRIVPILASVTSDLTASFKDITRAEHVTSVRVLVAKTGPVSLDVVVEFEDGSSALPQQVFSEGYKDLIALLFFLTMTKKAAEYGQAKVLVLDDALQSVDATIRLGLMEYIVREFKDWQIIITGHDRAWYEQLSGLLARRGRSFVERRIARWSFAGGPDVAAPTTSRRQMLESAVLAADARASAAAAGLLLEDLAQELSWRLGSGVTRRKGDRYTLGDLWPGVAKALKATELRETVEDIDLRIDLRNILGAHVNAWADSLPWREIELLAYDALALHSAAYCTACGGFLEKHGKSIRCQCGTCDLQAFAQTPGARQTPTDPNTKERPGSPPV